MSSGAEQEKIVWFPGEERGLKDFWEVYDAHFDEVSQGTTERLTNHPELGPLIKSIPQAQQAETNRRSRQLMRTAIVEGNWEPYWEDLRTQGTMYARGGLPFSAWFPAVAAFRTVLRPYLWEAYGRTPERFLASLEGMSTFMDKAMSAIGAQYLVAKEQIIGEQQEALREISTPVLQVRDRMLLVPIIGLIDTFRARQLTERLLKAIRTNRAKVVVMDITGVPAVDSKVANHLVQTVEAARLMGARAVITGLSSDVAQSLVTLGVDLRMLNTVGDLQGGLEEGERLLGVRLVSTSGPAAFPTEAASSEPMAA